MRNLSVLLLIFALTGAPLAAATAADVPRPLTGLSRDSDESFGRMLWEDFKSPVATDAKYEFYSASALALVLAIFKDDVGDPLLEDVSRDRPLGKDKYFDYAGQLIPNALYAGGMWIAGRADQAWVMTRASAMAGLTTTVLKYAIREKRPDSDAREAFPSGHSATIFSFAAVVGCEHHWAWAIPAYALAGLVGFSRLNDNRHQLHDVAAGAAIGLGYGLGVCRRERGKASPVAWMIVPERDGASVSYNLRF